MYKYRMITYKRKKKRNCTKRSTKQSTKQRQRGGVTVEKKQNYYLIKNANGHEHFIKKANIRKYEKYFNGVNLDKSIQESLLASLLKDMGVDSEHRLQVMIDKIITDQFKFEVECDKKKKKDWVDCNGNCVKSLKKLVEKEINSTAYMIRTLSKSTLWHDKKNNSNPITFKSRDNQTLNGKWSSDSKNIIIDINPTYTSNTPRLIMGFGPSASGKTYWAQNFIDIFSQIENFPKLFISIDGGIYRETSMVYQMIINTVKKTCIGGLGNLVPSMGTGIFKASIVKESMMNYLNDTQPKFSLYVPETLGGCGWPGSKIGVVKECREVYEKYIDYTNDTNWIGLLIWQHLNNSECTYSNELKCEGCTESGTRRQYNEGKIYSDDAYKHAIQKGYKHIIGQSYKDNSAETSVLGAPGGRFIIHNVGRATHIENSKPTSNTTQILDVTNDASNVLSIKISDDDNIRKYKYTYRTATEKVVKTELLLA